MTPDPGSVAAHFPLGGEPIAIESLGYGHINATYHVRMAGGGPRSGFVLQRVNHHVFPEPQQVMENWIRVSSHLRDKLLARNAPDVDRRHVLPISDHNGRPYHLEENGALWRLMPFIENSQSLEGPVSPEQAFEAAQAFGRFVRDLADLPAPPLHVTIQAFHDLDQRHTALVDAIRADSLDRAPAASREIEDCERGFDAVTAGLRSAETERLPRRTVHHDGKINNVLFDAAGREALCVIDLDTVMEGTVLSDFGELVRTVTCPQPEDVSDPSLVQFDPRLYHALANGYLSGGSDTLSAQEVRALPMAGPALTLMNALRFLTDHLSGDSYFPVAHEGQNIERCRAQLRRVELLQDNRNILEQAIDDAASNFALPR